MNDACCDRFILSSFFSIYSVEFEWKWHWRLCTCYGTSSSKTGSSFGTLLHSTHKNIINGESVDRVRRWAWALATDRIICNKFIITICVCVLKTSLQYNRYERDHCIAKWLHKSFSSILFSSLRLFHFFSSMRIVIVQTFAACNANWLQRKKKNRKQK